MRKFEHWQDPGKNINHGWVTAEDLKTNDGRTVLVARAPIGNRIALDMQGVIKLHAYLGELIEQETRAFHEAQGPRHVCGLRGYNGMIDPRCHACERAEGGQ